MAAGLFFILGGIANYYAGRKHFGQHTPSAPVSGPDETNKPGAPGPV
jgi:hypothetical protein